MYCKICTEGSLIIEFVAPVLSEETGALGTLRIKNWIFSYRRNQELVPRSTLALLQEQPNIIDNLLKNITRNGFTLPTLQYLKLCSVLEPMQELMARYKAWNGSQPPRECLRAAVVHKMQQAARNPGAGGPPMQFAQQQRMAMMTEDPNVKADVKGANQSPQAAQNAAAGNSI